jgi:hypothetical protein
MVRRLSPEEEAKILALIRSGLYCPDIVFATGRRPEVIRYTAAKHRLTIASRYKRIRPGTYWQAKMARRTQHEYSVADCDEETTASD